MTKRHSSQLLGRTLPGYERVRPGIPIHGVYAGALLPVPHKRYRLITDKPRRWMAHNGRSVHGGARCRLAGEVVCEPLPLIFACNSGISARFC